MEERINLLLKKNDPVDNAVYSIERDARIKQKKLCEAEAEITSVKDRMVNMMAEGAV